MLLLFAGVNLVEKTIMTVVTAVETNGSVHGMYEDISALLLSDRGEYNGYLLELANSVLKEFETNLRLHFKIEVIVIPATSLIDPQKAATQFAAIVLSGVPVIIVISNIEALNNAPHIIAEVNNLTDNIAAIATTTSISNVSEPLQTCFNYHA